MQVARTHFVNKSAALSSVAKNASCSSGWLHLTVQFIFAVITTVSFILIVLMVVTNPTPSGKPETSSPRCKPQNCRVLCTDAPYYGQWEDNIINAVAAAGEKCSRIILELHNPWFENNTLPDNWLPRLRSNIYELSISGGNLQHLPSGAFMSQFTGYTKTLSLQGLNIKTFHANSLVGLSSLETLNVVNCEIDSFQANSLRAVDDTLETLTITQSGSWDPINVTGSRGFEKLAIVDFSYNDFNTVLGKDSFVGLEHCKILYLNSCGIVSIGAGAFDQLTSIQVIYLHRNLLVTVPPGLFDRIALLENPRPRISLQENFWYCECGVDDLRQLVRKEILLVDVICTYPTTMNNKTFTEFEKYCANKTEDSFDAKLLENDAHHAGFNDRNAYIYGTCLKKNNNKSSNNDNRITFRLVAPLENSRCSLNRTRGIDVSSLTTRHVHSFNNSKWLNFSFFLKTSRYNAIYLGTAETKDFGLLWFQSDCPNDLYCIDSMPSFLRIYNVDERSQYTFCPMRLSTGTIENNDCVGYSMDDPETIENSITPNYLNWLIYTTTVLGCFSFGAVIVYGLIRINPILLKGSKRILFVKHKTVDALVLPPKIPLRNDLINDTALDSKDIFTLSSNDKLTLPKMNRMKSIHSYKSNSPSYISAMQPSEDQLAEWRISHHFNNDLTISSKSELSTLSWICGDTSYYSLDESDRTYESLK